LRLGLRSGRTSPPEARPRRSLTRPAAATNRQLHHEKHEVQEGFGGAPLRVLRGETLRRKRGIGALAVQGAQRKPATVKLPMPTTKPHAPSTTLAHDLAIDPLLRRGDRRGQPWIAFGCPELVEGMEKRMRRLPQMPGGAGEAILLVCLAQRQRRSWGERRVRFTTKRDPPSAPQLRPSGSQTRDALPKRKKPGCRKRLLASSVLGRLPVGFLGCLTNISLTWTRSYRTGRGLRIVNKHAPCQVSGAGLSRAPITRRD